MTVDLVEKISCEAENYMLQTMLLMKLFPLIVSLQWKCYVLFLFSVFTWVLGNTDTSLSSSLEVFKGPTEPKDPISSDQIHVLYSESGPGWITFYYSGPWVCVSMTGQHWPVVQQQLKANFQVHLQPGGTKWPGTAPTQDVKGQTAEVSFVSQSTDDTKTVMLMSLAITSRI